MSYSVIACDPATGSTADLVVITGGVLSGSMVEAIRRAGFTVTANIPDRVRQFEGLDIDWMIVDELPPSKPSAKRQALLAQYERARLQKNKNLMRDLSRQLERTW